MLPSDEKLSILQTIRVSYNESTLAAKFEFEVSALSTSAFRHMLLLAILLLIPSTILASVNRDSSIFTRAQNGDVNAQSYVAHLYATGQGVQQDYTKAKYWYQRIIDHQGADAKIVAHANLLLGMMYNTGKGANQSYSKAMQCYRIAADQGYFDAHINIGHLYAQGLGVKQDLNKALYWWELAHKEGHPKAASLVRLIKKEMAVRNS